MRLAALFEPGERPLKQPPKSDPPPRRKRRSPLSEGDYRAMGAFRLALRKFSAFSAAAAQEDGLTAQQHQALLAIRAHAGPDPMSISELADCLLIKTHSAVELVARLVARDLVIRTPDAADRRRIQLRLTRQAEPLLEEITRKNIRELNSTAPVFRDLLRTLRRIGEISDSDGGRG